MSNDLRNQLLSWISHQQEVLKRRIALGGNIDYAEGRLYALLDVKSFILTDGLLTEPTEQRILVTH